MRALVLERRGSYAIVLLPGGRFARIRAPHAAVGEEIDMTRRSLVPSARMRPYGYAAAALAVVLALLPAALPGAHAQVAAYATLDVNPSVQFGLSASGTVVNAAGLDQDGRRVLTQTHTVGVSLSQAVALILAAAAQDGFVGKGSDASVILATYASGTGTTVPPGVQQQVLAARATGKAFLASHDVTGIVSAMIVPPWLRQAARQAKVSPGVYAIYAALRGAGATLNVHQLEGRNLGHEIQRLAATPAGKSVLPLLTEGTSNTTTPTQPVTQPSSSGTRPLIVLTPGGDASVNVGGDVGQGKKGPGGDHGQGGSKGGPGDHQGQGGSNGSGQSSGQGTKESGNGGGIPGLGHLPFRTGGLGGLGGLLQGGGQQSGDGGNTQGSGSLQGGQFPFGGGSSQQQIGSGGQTQGGDGGQQSGSGTSSGGDGSGSQTGGDN